MTVAIAFTFSSLASLASSSDPTLSSSISPFPFHCRTPSTTNPHPPHILLPPHEPQPRMDNAFSPPHTPTQLARKRINKRKKYCEQCRHVIYLSKIALPAYHTVHYEFSASAGVLFALQLGFRIYFLEFPNLLITHYIVRRPGLYNLTMLLFSRFFL